MRVLSLFDGMSCGQIALNKIGIKPSAYYASEIKPVAIKVAQHNYPDTIQVGDVREIRASDVGHIDLLIGGSPCQDFSRANSSRDGLQGSKSGLFYEYLRLFDELKPRHWLLENVVMPPHDQAIVSGLLGRDPVRINSSLVSAQLRDRLYWTNIGGSTYDLFGRPSSARQLPQDKGELLQDILTSGTTDRKKARALLESDSRPLANQEKIIRRYKNGFTTIVFEDGYVRYFNQTELELLQTVPLGYTSCLTRNQAASVLGDGWTVDVIAHIFAGLK